MLTTREDLELMLPQEDLEQMPVTWDDLEQMQPPRDDLEHLVYVSFQTKTSVYLQV